MFKCLKYSQLCCVSWVKCSLAPCCDTFVSGHGVRIAPFFKPRHLCRPLDVALSSISGQTDTNTVLLQTWCGSQETQISFTLQGGSLRQLGWTCPRALSVSYACLNYSQSELMAVTGKKEGFLEEIACLKCVSGYISVWAFWMPLKSGKAVRCRLKVRSHLWLFCEFSWVKSSYFNRNPCDLQ